MSFGQKSSMFFLIALRQSSVSLVPIFGKVFEKILFNSIFEYLQENCLLCDNQSGFQPSDSCEYQLLSIVHDIYASFDCNPPKDVRDIS